ncbi:hypothetical protein DM01DRAFT_362193 [Hesseltinella vesiculosa]|uniref:Uncharacterized protein n=1 Tax=Hesseltinella vesiculosa TaxID=101127 RepID=A0A1X2GF37_9FUNG|nr:hypothetical protein DM01DRAFT_362193 [Hesseltinella vesiculosa]
MSSYFRDLLNSEASVSDVTDEFDEELSASPPLAEDLVPQKRRVSSLLDDDLHDSIEPEEGEAATSQTCDVFALPSLSTTDGILPIPSAPSSLDLSQLSTADSSHSLQFPSQPLSPTIQSMPSIGQSISIRSSCHCSVWTSITWKQLNATFLISSNHCHILNRSISIHGKKIQLTLIFYYVLLQPISWKKRDLLWIDYPCRYRHFRYQYVPSFVMVPLVKKKYIQVDKSVDHRKLMMTTRLSYLQLRPSASLPAAC